MFLISNTVQDSVCTCIDHPLRILASSSFTWGMLPLALRGSKEGKSVLLQVKDFYFHMATYRVGPFYCEGGGLGGPRAGHAEMRLRKEVGLVREDMACIPTKWCLSPNLKNEERLNRSNSVFINSEWLYIGHWELVFLLGKVIFFALDCIICEPSYLDSFVHFF